MNGAEVLLVTGDDEVAREVHDLAAAVGVVVRQVGRVATAGTAWHRAPLVLLGEDAATGDLDRDDVVLVTSTGSASAWQRAATVGASRVVVLPDARGQLLELLAGRTGPGRRGPVVGVVGGRGGAGASTFALALGLAAVWSGAAAVLVDGDPLGGGVDLLAGVEDRPGLRWPDLDDARGSVRSAVLTEGLPDADGLRLLSWDRSSTPTAGTLDPDAARVVLSAAAAAHDVVVVDLPRGSGPADVALWRLLDAVVLVVPTELRAAVAAVRLADQLRAVVSALHLVVRVGPRSSVTAGVVAEVLELPVTATWDDDPRLPAAAERSDLLSALWHRRSRRPAAAVLDAVLPGPVAGEAERPAS